MSRRLKIREIAERLGLTKPTVLKMLRDKKIPGADVIYVDERGRDHWRIDREAFEAWMGGLFQGDKGLAAPVIYFVQEAEEPDGPVKIGLSTGAGLNHRLIGLQVSNHRRLIVLATMLGDKSVEQELHGRFAGSHVRGEWFHMTPELRGLIEDASKRKDTAYKVDN